MKPFPQLSPRFRILTFAATTILAATIAQPVNAQRGKDTPVRVFIFAGQSNMVGSDSHAEDIENFPPFAGLDGAQDGVAFAYCIGREEKTRSAGWEHLQPINNVVGPELSFARTVAEKTKGRIAIIKVAAGGTHLGGDWNPDDPQGFKMYPLALTFVQEALADLDKKGLTYQLEGFMWHQGENDMFNEEYMQNYGANLKNFLACWRRDLNCPELKFYVGELCTKTIWGMDLRNSMYAISKGQKLVTESDPHAEYVPTSHVGVEIGGGVGLHYHYGTLGQLEHGENYARAYLNCLGEKEDAPVRFDQWPFPQKSKVKLFVLAGHRNMEGERAFVQDLSEIKKRKPLLRPKSKIAFKYSIGGGYKTSADWGPLRPAGFYDTFGPELSFGANLRKQTKEQIAIAKFTHSGSQIIDWTPEGSDATSRNLYTKFIQFVAESVSELEAQGHTVELAGVFYHVGENDMSFGPYRKQAAQRLAAIITQSRIDLERPELKWFVTQQTPTDEPGLNKIDVVGEISSLAAEDPHWTHIGVFNLEGQEKQLVISTAGIIQLGEKMAESYLKQD